MSITYESIDAAEFSAEADRVTAQAGSSTSDFLDKFVKLPDGDGFVLMRILPRKKGQKLYCATRTHRLSNPATGKSRSVHCPRELVMGERGHRWDGKCIICEYYSDLWKQSEARTGKDRDDLRAKARAIKPVERYYYNVVVRQEKQKDGTILKNVGPKIFSCGKTVHAKIVRAIAGDPQAGEKPLGDVTHPTNGRDFRLVKKVVVGGGGAEYPNYDLSKFVDTSPLGEGNELEQWIANQYDLVSLRVVKTHDALKHELKIHLGIAKDSPMVDELAEFRAGSGVPVKDDVKTRLQNPQDDDDVLTETEFMDEISRMM